MSEVPVKLFSVLVLTLGLGACATGPREGPPAPVVSVTPRQGAVEPEAEPVAAPKPKPATPAKKQTQTYAYREPGSEPEPAPEPAPPPEAVAPPPVAAPAAGAEPAAPQRPAPPVAAPAPNRDAPARQPAAPVAKTVPPPVAPAEEPASAPAPPVEAPPTRVAQAPAPAPSAPSDKPLIPGLPPAADALARQAEQQRQTGDYAGAAASLERSLRVAPREAYLWNRLARVRMEQGLSAQAGQLAARSNDLAGSQASIKKDNWRIIAESKRRAGDTAGASEAEKRAGGG